MDFTKSSPFRMIGLGEDEKITALDNISATISCQGPIACVGDSGSGKSTFLNLLSGKLTPTKGSINISPQGTQVVYLEKGFSFAAGQTILENLVAAFSEEQMTGPSKLTPEELAVAVASIASMVGLKERLHSGVKARDLSGGEVLSFGIALALARGCRRNPQAPDTLLPPVLALDEFLDSEDSRVRVKVEAMLKRLTRDQGVGVLFSTHDMNAACELADEVLVFCAGHIIQQAAPADTAYIRSQYEALVKKYRREVKTSQAFDRTMDNLWHLRPPNAGKSPGLGLGPTDTVAVSP
ncbi:unnamed protein product [Chrysoparadoxa australica]